MPYPSFLWQREETDARDPGIPEETVADLSLEEEIRSRSIPTLRILCNAREIPMRQGLFFRLLGDGAFREKLAALTDELSAAEQLTGEMDRSEQEEEKILLFPTVMSRIFAILRTLASFAGDEGRAGEIGAFWKHWLEEPAPAYAEKRSADLLARYDPSFRLKLRGTDVSAWERRRGMRDEFEGILREMDLEDAIPSFRAPQKATPTVIRGYAGVHAAWYEAAAAFWTECSGPFLGGDRDVRGIFSYLGELHFLADVTEYLTRLRDAGYPLTAPAVSGERELVLDGLVDPSLRRRNIPGGDVVPNDLAMYAERGGERLSFFILSGANGGGKTTFLRAAALAVLFFSAGCPVTAKSGRSMIFDGIYTHFPSNESFESGGRFADECERADRILEEATADSFAVFNETYSGTDERRSEEYSSRLAHTMYDRGTFGIYVTHIHALTGGEIPTLAAMIDENDENRRTYRIRRVGGTSSSFAKDILEKYGLDRASLEARLTAEKGGR